MIELEPPGEHGVVQGNVFAAVPGVAAFKRNTRIDRQQCYVAEPAKDDRLEQAEMLAFQLTVQESRELEQAAAPEITTFAEDDDTEEEPADLAPVRVLKVKRDEVKLAFSWRCIIFRRNS